MTDLVVLLISVFRTKKVFSNTFISVFESSKKHLECFFRSIWNV